MGNEDVLARLDEMIFDLTSRTDCTTWEIRMRENLAKALFGNPIPKKYKSYAIVIDDVIEEIQMNDGHQSDILIIQAG